MLLQLMLEKNQYIWPLRVDTIFSRQITKWLSWKDYRITNKRFDRIFCANIVPFDFAIREVFQAGDKFLQWFPAESLGICKKILILMQHSFSKFKKSPFYKQWHASRKRNAYFGKIHFRKNSPLKIISTNFPWIQID